MSGSPDPALRPLHHQAVSGAGSALPQVSLRQLPNPYAHFSLPSACRKVLSLGLRPSKASRGTLSHPNSGRTPSPSYSPTGPRAAVTNSAAAVNRTTACCRKSVGSNQSGTSAQGLSLRGTIVPQKVVGIEFIDPHRFLVYDIQFGRDGIKGGISRAKLDNYSPSNCCLAHPYCTELLHRHPPTRVRQNSNGSGQFLDASEDHPSNGLFSPTKMVSRITSTVGSGDHHLTPPVKISSPENATLNFRVYDECPSVGDGAYFSPQKAK